MISTGQASNSRSWKGSLADSIENLCKSEAKLTVIGADDVLCTLVLWSGLGEARYQELVDINSNSTACVDLISQLPLFASERIQTIENALQQVHDFALHKDLGNVFVKMSALYRAIPIELAHQYHELIQAAEMTDSSLEIQNWTHDLCAETLLFHLPLAKRLGMWRAKRDLEDIILLISDGSGYYTRVEEYLQMIQSGGRGASYEEIVRHRILKRLSAIDIIDATVHPDWCSIAGAKRRALAQYGTAAAWQQLPLHSLVTFSVQVKTVRNCYEALAILHQMGAHWQGEFSDSVAKPKLNGYSALDTRITFENNEEDNTPESLHTTSCIRIQTHSMTDIAQHGILSKHFFTGYQELSYQQFLDSKVGLAIETFQQSLRYSQSHDQRKNKQNESTEEIVVYTPMGEPRVFPDGATVLDFAYNVHSRIGLHAVKAKVGGALVPLNHRLQNGDVVRIITNLNQRPQEEWLAKNYVYTTHARQRLKKQLNKNPAFRGRRLLVGALRRKGVQLDANDLDQYIDSVRLAQGYSSTRDLLTSLGVGSLPSGQIAREIINLVTGQPTTLVTKGQLQRYVPSLPEDISIGPKPWIKMCRACHPQYPQQICGYLRKNHLTVHSVNCSALESIQGRVFTLKWKNELAYEFILNIIADERTGLVRDISDTINRMQCSYREVHAIWDGKQPAQIKVRLALTHINTLYAVREELRTVPHVIDVIVDQRNLPNGIVDLIEKKYAATDQTKQFVASPLVPLTPLSISLPFNPSLPCHENRFFGRDKEKSELIEHLVHGQGLTFLIGPSRSGKSSLASNFLHRTGHESNHVTVLVDCRRQNMNKAQILWKMANDFYRTVLRNHSKDNKSLQPPNTEQFQFESETAFLTYTGRLLDAFNQNVIFVLDEFESLVVSFQNSGVIEQDFFAFLREISYTDHRIKLLLIGSMGLMARLRKSQLQSDVKGMPILQLSPNFIRGDDALRMIIQPFRNQNVEFVENSESLVLEQTNCWPYYMAVLGNGIAKYLDQHLDYRISRSIVDEAINHVTEPGIRDTYYGYLRDELSTGQFTVLHALAKQKGVLPKQLPDLLNMPYVKQAVSQEEISEIIQTLKAEELISEQEDSSHLFFNVKLIERWLYRQNIRI